MIRRVEGQWMSLVGTAGLLVLLLTAGCAGKERAPKGEPPQAAAKQEEPVAAKPAETAPTQEKAVAAKPAETAPKQEVPVALESTSPPAAPPAATSQSAAKPATPAAKPPAQVAATPAPAAPAPKKETAAPPPAPKPAAAPLNLASLEKRLKETSAIGVFTKLTLKNQVDALLEQFRGYYQGRIKTTLAQLRQPYDQLLMKVLSLLQDSDPPLARDITQSREAIWGILSDPDKFDDL